MSNVCAGIGRGQMTVLDDHIAHHKHVQQLYRELLADVPGVTLHDQPADGRYDSNFWLCAATLDPSVRIVGQENAYKTVITSAVGGAAGVIKAVESAVTDGSVCALNIPAGQWHTLRALDPGTVILEMKDGPYEPIQECDVLK